MAKNGKSRPNDWRRLNEVFEAAVELPTADQDAFLDKSCGDDSDLRARAVRLLEAARKIGDEKFLSDDAFQVGARIIAGRDEVRNSAGRHIGRFKIVSEIAHGGMGTVYLAERDDFQQRVALKLIRAGFDSAEILRRFRIERDVLASLNHPNIARLLDGGTTDDGQPFLAIEYVEGERIDDYCDSHELDLDQRLVLFRKVCAAVAYAHQNLTVHRDLKPSNILVTPDGEPKLLDFGIAKLLAGVAATDETATADRLLTPEYASPEQLRGEKISTASDVYSLGVLLFELMTGHRPFELRDRSAFEVVEAVCNSEAPAPSSQAVRTDDMRTHSIAPSQLKGDLDNIILKALRKDPGLRYSSVEQLSEDIRRHRDGLPIVARPMTFKYRASKFVLRNRAPVAFASLAIVALVLGAAIAIWQAVVARNEAAIAQQRFNDVRSLANTFVNDWHEGLPEENISPEIRARLANISSDYLAKLAADTDDPEVLREAADAQIKLGHEYAYFMIDAEKARVSFRDAEQIARRLVAADPKDKAARSLLVESLMKYTEFFGAENLDASIASREEQIRLRELNLAADPDDVTELRDLAILHEQTGDNLRQRGDNDAARRHYELSDELHTRRVAVVENLPKTSENAARLATTLSMRAWNLGENLGDRVGAVAIANRAVDVASAAVDFFPTERPPNIALINANSELGHILKRSGNHRRAIEVFQASVDTNRRFAQNRSEGFFNRREYDAILEIAESYHLIGDDRTAYAFVKEAMSIRRQFTSRPEHAASFLTFLSHATLFEAAGRLLGQMGRITEAEVAFDESEAYLDRIPVESRHKPVTGQHKSSLMISRGDMISRANKCQPALRSPSLLDAACIERSLNRDPKGIESANYFYRRALESISSLPREYPRTYHDNVARRAAEQRLEMAR